MQLLKKTAVLVVDDQQPDRTLAIREIRKIFPHAEILEANSGEEGAIKFLEYFPEIVITDINMPGVMNGLEMGRTILSIRPETTIVVMSDKQREQDLAVIEETVQFTFLHKKYPERLSDILFSS